MAIKDLLNPTTQDEPQWSLPSLPKTLLPDDPGVFPAPTQPAPPAAGPTIPADQGTTPKPTQPAPPAQGPSIPSSSWNTDGFAAPSYTASRYDSNALSGWEASKWNDPNHQTPKYVVGRILSNYPDNPGGLTAAIQDIQRAYPGASLVNPTSGTINIPGIGLVDVGVSFGSGGGRGWAWQPISGSTPTNSTASTVQGGTAAPTSSVESLILQALSASPSYSTASVGTPSASATPTNVTSGTTFTQYPAGTIAPTGKPAADGNPNWVVGGGVPGMTGMIYNSVGGYEPGGAGNPVPGMPGASYGADGYTVVNAPTGSASTVSPATTSTTGSLDPSVLSALQQLFGGGSTSDTTGLPASNQFTDPATVTLDNLIRERIQSLMTPINDPTQTQAQLALQTQMANLLTPLQTPAATQTFQDVITQAIQQLQGPTFSDAELANMQARAFDTLNRQEQAEIENTTRTLANHGVPPSSGLVQHAIQQVRDKYDELKAQQQQQLNQYAIDSANQRRAQLLQTAQTGSNVALTQQQQDEARKAQVSTLAQQLVEMARQARGEQSTNADKAISFAGVPVDITERRVANAANLGQGGTANASNVVNSISSLLQGFNNQTNTNQANSASYWGNLAQALSTIDWSKVFS